MSSLQISGVFPEIAVQAGSAKPRNELGIGALMPWAGKLWATSYIAHKGHNAGLYSIDKKLNVERHAQSVSGTFANRLMHDPSDSIIIGPHVIDGNGNVRTSKQMSGYRLAGTSRHLSDPDNKVYMLTMEGPFFEMDLHTLEGKELCNLTYELGVHPERTPGWQGKAEEGIHTVFPQPHFKACHTGQGHVFVANNSYFEADHLGEAAAGRLGEWDGNGHWKVVREGGFNEVTGRNNLGEYVFAVGWDRSSAILMVRDPNSGWREYRLPKASQTFEHCWQTEWPRLREVQHERYMLNASGMIYEMSGWLPDGKLSGVRPVCSHLRVIADFAGFAGLLVMGDNQVSPVGNTWNVGESQSNFWFGHIEDLWSWGKPNGWGGPWTETAVKAGNPSSPYLMTGFDKKSLHLRSSSDHATRVRIEIDFQGNQSWCAYAELEVGPCGYTHHVFPYGFSAHWVRLVPATDAILTANLHYT